MQLSIEAARALMLASQGLLAPPNRPARKQDVLETVRRMGALQIDTIHVVARSPYLVLWSRLGEYEPAWLDELLAEGKLFEYWAHAACFLPIEDYPLYRRRMLDATRWQQWIEAHPERVGPVLERLQTAGEVRSADFERQDGGQSGWWSWKPEKHVLELLFSAGTVMIARRENFQRVYDLRERILPGWDDVRALTSEEARRAWVLKTVKALGIVKARWIPDYFKIKSTGLPAILAELEAEGLVLRAEVEGWNVPGYIHADNEKLARSAARGRLIPTLTTLLSPFDPLIWDRKRVEELFGFAYRIEVYTPFHQRRYGYFTMPILHRGALIGRIDPKAHRKEGVLEVRALHLEPDVEATDELVADLRDALARFARWHGLQDVVVRASDLDVMADSQFPASAA